MPATVNSRGQITVDRSARQRLGVRPGMIAVQQVIGNQLVVTFIPAPHNRSSSGVLGSPPRDVPSDWNEIREAAEQALASEVEEHA